MKTNEMIRAVLFFALLFVVVVEFVYAMRINMTTLPIEALIAATTTLTNLGLIDKVLLISLLGMLAFMKDSEH